MSCAEFRLADCCQLAYASCINGDSRRYLGGGAVMVIRAGRGGVGRSVRLAIVTAFLLTGIVGVTAPAVSAAAGCSETTKFVQELSANPGTLSAKYFGISRCDLHIRPYAELRPGRPEFLHPSIPGLLRVG